MLPTGINRQIAAAEQEEYPGLPLVHRARQAVDLTGEFLNRLTAWSPLLADFIKAIKKDQKSLLSGDCVEWVEVAR